MFLAGNIEHHGQVTIPTLTDIVGLTCTESGEVVENEVRGPDDVDLVGGEVLDRRDRHRTLVEPI